MIKHKKGRKTVEIMGVRVTITPRKKLLKNIVDSIASGRKVSVFTPNPEIMVKAHKSSNYRKVLRSADYLLADGVGITIAARLFYKQKIQRYPGREFFVDLLDAANKNSWKIFLLGADQKTIKKSCQIMSKEYPKVIVKGYSDIYVGIKKYYDIDISTKDDIDILSSINKFSPDILIVALGAPKQEVFINKYFSKLNFKLAMGAGGSLDYFAGTQVLPPKIISRLGLEWLWRLVFQPRRFKRIFNALVIFPVLVVLEKLGLLDTN